MDFPSTNFEGEDLRGSQGKGKPNRRDLNIWLRLYIRWRCLIVKNYRGPPIPSVASYLTKMHFESGDFVEKLANQTPHMTFLGIFEGLLLSLFLDKYAEARFGEINRVTDEIFNILKCPYGFTCKILPWLVYRFVLFIFDVDVHNFPKTNGR